MSVADPFCAGFRLDSNTSPGAMDRIVFADPAGLMTGTSWFSVDLPEDKSRAFLERIWNMETWSVALSYSFDFTIAIGLGVGRYQATGGASGQWSTLSGDVFAAPDGVGGLTQEGIVSGGIYRPTPQDRVGGDMGVNKVRFPPFGGTTTTWSREYRALLSPEFDLWTAAYGPVQGDLSSDLSLESGGAKIGDFRVTVGMSGLEGEYLYAETNTTLSVSYAWIKPDGTVTLAVTLTAALWGDSNYMGVVNIGNTATAPSGYTAHSISLSLFGKSVSAWAYTDDGYPDFIFHDLDFSYDVSDVTLYTYPGD